MLKICQLRNTTSFIPIHSTNLSLFYTMIRTKEMQITIIGVTIRHYVENMPTKEHNQFYSNTFHQPFSILHHDQNKRNANNYYWSNNKKVSSRNFKIGPILAKKEPLKQFLIFVTNSMLHNKFKF